MTSYNPDVVGNINPEDIPDLGSDDEPCVDDVEPPTEEEMQLWWSASKDLEKLNAGFRTRSMDDKWDLLVEDPDEQGNISLHILRNWAYTEYFILHIVSNEDGGGAVIQDITWEGNNDGFRCEAEQAQKEAVILCRLFLECEFKTIPQYPSSAIWSPEGYKKLEAQ
ncbi:unnamed protein product [Clonostachys byssicola]|uniref:Uncharacterized protein n=1 Tax=Clonostachys byssicola TaxID=160290 RepID=A0A9N9UST3_9HYPO|nr:unnamed protein product [Clonostachys byssicola]